MAKVTVETTAVPQTDYPQPPDRDGIYYFPVVGKIADIAMGFVNLAEVLIITGGSFLLDAVRLRDQESPVKQSTPDRQRHSQRP